MKVIDEGHTYELANLDGEGHQLISFVKRQGDNYPGNSSVYEGVTSQMVLRPVVDRTRYLQGQKKCLENLLIIICLRLALWLFEFRGARHNGRFYLHSLDFAEKAPMCEVCGHTVCHHQKDKL
jgi:hypothetical protein